MGRSSPRKFRRRKSHRPFLEKGLNALILGAGLWLIPQLMSGQPLLSIKSNALQILAWFLMGIGLLLLGIHYVLKDKHWRSKPVGVKEVREFFGVMASHQLKRGTYATTSTFTTDAVDFAKRNGIHLLDGKGLLKLIGQRTPEQQQALLAVAFEGDYARPTCASCGIKMVTRTPSKGGSAFWGCTNYPRCRSRLGMIAS